MNEIKKWLGEHPMISIRGMEKELGIPFGTIRVSGDKPIPDKYIERIRIFLKDYGMLTDCVTERKVYFIRNGHLMTKENGLFARKTIGESIPLYMD